MESADVELAGIALLGAHEARGKNVPAQRGNQGQGAHGLPLVVATPQDGKAVILRVVAQTDVAVGGNQRTNWAQCLQLRKSTPADRFNALI